MKKPDLAIRLQSNGSKVPSPISQSRIGRLDSPTCYLLGSLVQFHLFARLELTRFDKIVGEIGVSMFDAEAGKSRQAIIHSLAHTASWAIDLSWDIIARFGKQEKMPRDFFTDFVRVAQNEGRHFTLLAARLEEIGSHYGALPAHDGLWDSATTTSQDLLARLAIEHCVHEARGLMYFPRRYPGFRTEAISRQQICWRQLCTLKRSLTVQLELKWFKYLCTRSKDPELTIDSKESDDSNEEIINKFHSVVREHFRGPPFNAEARKAAGFGPQWYEPLAVKESKA